MLAAQTAVVVFLSRFRHTLDRLYIEEGVDNRRRRPGMKPTIIFAGTRALIRDASL